MFKDIMHRFGIEFDDHHMSLIRESNYGGYRFWVYNADEDCVYFGAKYIDSITFERYDKSFETTYSTHD